MSANSYFKDIQGFVPLTRQEEVIEFKKAKLGDKQAYNTIIKSNLRFVVSIAKTYVGRGLDLEDLIAEGNVGLLKAYNTFDVDRNFKFITYAVWWIRQSILYAIQEYGKTVRTPANKINGKNKAVKKKLKLEQQLGTEIALHDIANYTDDEYLIAGAKQHISILDLDEPINESGVFLKDIISVESHQDVEPIEAAFLEELTILIKDFPEREKDIIYYYYGIDGDRSFTLTEIGEKLGLTRERIRQIKSKVLSKIKEHDESDNLRGFIT